LRAEEQNMAKPLVKAQPPAPALSDAWRLHRSSERAKEFTQLLRAVNNFLGLMGSDIAAEWAGQGSSSHTDFARGRVVLDPGPLLKAPCPIPGHLVDVVIGSGIHEGGHCVLTLPEALELLQEQLPPEHRQGRSLTLAHTILNILEDCYLEDWIRRTYPTLFKYIQAAHRYYCSDRKQKHIFRRLQKEQHIQAMLDAFMVVSILQAPMAKGLSVEIARRLAYLQRITARVLREDDPGKRVALALEVWQQFARWYPEEASSKAPTRQRALLSHACGLERRKKKLPQELAGAIVVELLGEPAVSSMVPQEVTSAIREFVEGQPVSRTVVVQASYDPDRVQALSEKVFPYVQQVNAAFQRAETSGKRAIAGLHSGILSRRRLERIVYDSRVFEKRMVQRRLDLALFVLLDASQSVANDWPLLEELAYALVEALKGQVEVSLEVAAYQGVGECRFTSLYRSATCQLCLGGFSPSGRTPTGEALLTAGLLLQAAPKRTKVILHCTDGEPDRVSTVKATVSQLDHRGIQVVTLSTQRESNSLLKECYKGRLQTIASLADLPDAILNLLGNLLRMNTIES
jgi:hypothetical protein